VEKLRSSFTLLKGDGKIKEDSQKYVVIFQKRVAGLNELSLDRFLARARRAVGLKGNVNVLVTSGAKMKSLNRRFRGKDKPTDVLSFPAGPDDGNQLAGEIAISSEIASKNARLLGHHPAEEIKILVLHGLLHLRGFDHERDKGEMAKREHSMRVKLRLPSGLIERSSVERSNIDRSKRKTPRSAKHSATPGARAKQKTRGKQER
jgi:probable rRNA maturation factor